MKQKALLHLYLPEPGLYEALPDILYNDITELWIEAEGSGGFGCVTEIIRAAPYGKIVPILSSSADLLPVADASGEAAGEKALIDRVAIRLEDPVSFLSKTPDGRWTTPSVCLVDDRYRDIERDDEGGLRRRLEEIQAAATALREIGARKLSLLLFHPDPVIQLKSSRFISQKTGIRTIVPLYQESGNDTTEEVEGLLVDSAIHLSGVLSSGISNEILLRPALEQYHKEGAVQEAVQKAKLILAAMDLTPKSHELISCPTCGRCLLDLSHAARSIKAQLERLVSDLGPKKRLLEESGGVKVAVMGCNVNGPGEAAGADIGVAGGKNGTGTIFKFGKPVKTVTEAEIVPEMIRGMIEVIEDKTGGEI